MKSRGWGIRKIAPHLPAFLFGLIQYVRWDDAGTFQRLAFAVFAGAAAQVFAGAAYLVVTSLLKKVVDGEAPDVSKEMYRLPVVAPLVLAMMTFGYAHFQGARHYSRIVDCVAEHAQEPGNGAAVELLQWCDSEGAEAPYIDDDYRD